MQYILTRSCLKQKLLIKNYDILPVIRHTSKFNIRIF